VARGNSAEVPVPRASCLAPGEHGFTILELMIVLTIAGILLTLAEPSFSSTIHKAREASLKQSLFTMRDVIDQYRADTGKYPPALADLKSAGYLKRIPIDPFTRSISTWQEIQDQAEGGVFDVRSGSDLVGSDGVPYNQW
jgi:general secretion pathway protein G